MPNENTYESKGLFITPDFNVYKNLMGMDACEVPFPANSFNTIVATEVFSYGLDRAQCVSELVRVLAPGGTLAFTDNSQEILKFPRLAAELRKSVSDLNVLDNPRGFYGRTLAKLGMKDFVCRPFFDRSLAALTFSILYAIPSKAKREYYQHIINDPEYRSIHKEALLAIASGLEDEFHNTGGPPGGWHVFISCKKPGFLSSDLPVPQPCCLGCGKTLEISLRRCVLRVMRQGISHALRYSLCSAGLQ
jgi:SAM-dependent methyltransferase